MRFCCFFGGGDGEGCGGCDVEVRKGRKRHVEDMAGLSSDRSNIGYAEV